MHRKIIILIKSLLARLLSQAISKLPSVSKAVRQNRVYRKMIDMYDNYQIASLKPIATAQLRFTPNFMIRRGDPSRDNRIGVLTQAHRLVKTGFPVIGTGPFSMRGKQSLPSERGMLQTPINY